MSLCSRGIFCNATLRRITKRLAFSPDALRAIYRHRWPGNVREMQNRVKRAVIMADGKRLTADDLELTGFPIPCLPRSRKLAKPWRRRSCKMR